MAIHASIFAWKISWTEGPGGLQSMGSQRLRHVCVIECAWAHTHMLDKSDLELVTKT